MPIKNNDDVAHLLEATGGSSASYREFEAPSDQMSAPLIDAVFAKGPPDPAPEMHRPLPIQTGMSPPDLLSEVFEGAPRNAPPAHPYPPSNTPPAAGYPQAMVRSDPVGLAPLIGRMPAAGRGMAAKRSLSDIRRIITKRVEEVPSAPPSGGLNGLFDRLAG
jgi:hypothetical protein